MKFLSWISFFLLPLVFSVGNIMNCAKWWDIDVIMFPDINSSELSVEKILSIRVFDFVLMRVGDVIRGSKDDD